MFQRADTAVLRFLRTRGHSPGAELAMKRLGLAAEWGALWSAAALGAAAIDGPRRGSWLRVAALAPASILANYVAKLTVRRRRPDLPGLPPVSHVTSKLSFPSAHAVSSFAAATAIGRVEPAASLPAYSLATVIAIGRPYLGVHYPSDVIAGAALGTAIGTLAPLEELR